METLQKIFYINEELKLLIILILLSGFLISFWRQVLGLKDIGLIYTYILAIIIYKLGFFNFIILFVIIFSLGYILSKITYRLYLLKFAKITIFNMISFLILLYSVNLFEKYSNFTFNFSMFEGVLFIILFNKIYYLTTKFNFKKLSFLIFEGSVVPLFSSIILMLISKANLVNQYFGLMFVILIISTFISGKYKGLRVSEIVKFNKLLKNID